MNRAEITCPCYSFFFASTFWAMSLNRPQWLTRNRFTNIVLSPSRVCFFFVSSCVLLIVLLSFTFFLFFPLIFSLQPDSNASPIAQPNQQQPRRQEQQSQQQREQQQLIPQSSTPKESKEQKSQHQQEQHSHIPQLSIPTESSSSIPRISTVTSLLLFTPSGRARSVQIMATFDDGALRLVCPSPSSSFNQSFFAFISFLSLPSIFPLFFPIDSIEISAHNSRREKTMGNSRKDNECLALICFFLPSSMISSWVLTLRLPHESQEELQLGTANSYRFLSANRWLSKMISLSMEWWTILCYYFLSFPVWLDQCNVLERICCSWNPVNMSMEFAATFFLFPFFPRHSLFEMLSIEPCRHWFQS